MCNLYGLRARPDDLHKALPIDRNETGNLPPLLGIFPDQMRGWPTTGANWR